jgi:hypothetical protein
MMKNYFLAAFGVIGVAAGVASAQTQLDIPIQFRDHQAFQQAVVIGQSGAQTVMAGMIGPDGRMGLLNVPGKPFNGTEVRRSVQTLANGAKIEHSDSNLLYRDEQGRTRVEQTLNGKTTVVIMDPVSRSVFVLNPQNKTARKSSIPAAAQEGGVSVANGGVTMQFKTSTVNGVATSSSTATTSVDGRGSGSGSGAGAGTFTNVAIATAGELHARTIIPDGKRTTEDLGAQYVNGVTAQGTRDTQTIPAQSIGNDRELQVVDEHWYSNDLQMLVKSVNSDPRFGETTYQLTNIVRGGQDPMLFQVPADYTINSETKFELSPTVKQIK